MPDTETPIIDTDVIDTRPTVIARLIAAMLGLIPDANRVALYLTVIADIAGVSAVVAGDLGGEEVTAVLVAVGAINAKVLMFLKGWQQMESADYEAQLMGIKQRAVLEQHAVAANVGKPGSRAARVAVPGGLPR